MAVVTGSQFGEVDVQPGGEAIILPCHLGAGDPILRASAYSEVLVETAFEGVRKAWPGLDACYRLGVHDPAVAIHRDLAGGALFFIDKTPRCSTIRARHGDRIHQVRCEARAKKYLGG